MRLVIDDLRVDQSFRCTRALKPFDFRYLFLLYFREVPLMSVTLCAFGTLFLRIMLSGDTVAPASDPELRQLMEDFDRGVFEQSHSSITEDLKRTLPYHTSPEESGAVGLSEPRVERGLEGIYDRDSDD